MPATETNECCICKRPVVIKPGTAWIHMSTAWKPLPVDTPDDHPESQGAFPVGPDCAKREDVRHFILS